MKACREKGRDQQTGPEESRGELWGGQRPALQDLSSHMEDFDFGSRKSSLVQRFISSVVHLAHRMVLIRPIISYWVEMEKAWAWKRSIGKVLMLGQGRNDDS